MANNPPKTKVTIRDVGKRVGVSPATVGRVVGGYGSVSQKTREKVLKAIDELGYYPDGIAQSLKGKRIQTIGMIVSDICNPFFGTLVRAVEDTLIKHGYNLIVCNTDDDVEKEISYIRTLTEKRVDGVLTCTAWEVDQPVNRELRNFYTSLPTVFIDREIKSINAPIIQADNAGGVYDAVSHLVNIGHQNIAVIAGGPNVSSIYERLEGYKRALREHGITFNPNFIRIGDFAGVEAGELAVKQLLAAQTGEKPTAIIALNNLLTTGALLGIHAMGLKIPHDVALIGWDDFDLASVFTPPLTVVTQPSYSMGTISAERIINKMQQTPNGHQEQDMKVVLKTHLVVRQSCGAMNHVASP